MSEQKVVVLVTVPVPEPLLERLRAVSPHVEVHLEPAKDPDQISEDLWTRTDVLYTIDTLPDPDQAPNLRWIQFHYAGIDHAVDHPLLQRDIAITTMSGASAPQMAEFVLMGILALGHRLPAIMTDSAERRWAEGRFQRYQPIELSGSTVGILGYGSVGREVARLCHAFGAQVLATKHDLRHLSDEGYILEGLGDPEADIPRRLYPSEAMRSMVSLCDFVVVTLPLTPQTRGLVDETVLGALKEGSFLIDVSRGGVVDHGALVETLNDGRLAGALLDVYPVEPLPDSSPLWDMPQVILSPHIAGGSVYYFDRAMTLFAANLQRYLSGQALLNRYDPARGY